MSTIGRKTSVEVTENRKPLHTKAQSDNGFINKDNVERDKINKKHNKNMRANKVYKDENNLYDKSKINSEWWEYNKDLSESAEDQYEIHSKQVQGKDILTIVNNKTREDKIAKAQY